MFSLDRRHFRVTGLSVAIVSLIMVFIGVKVVLGNEINIDNIVVFIGFSILVGIIASSLVYFRFKIAFLFFIIGLVIGLFEMYRNFLNGMSGWGDLIGIISLFTWTIIGFGLGILSQLGYYVYKKFKNR